MSRRRKILLLTPPFVQLNTPYPATMQLVGWLESLGVAAEQRDLSIEVALDVLRTYGEQPLTDEVIAFLQGRAPDDAETLAEPGYLPEGPAFDSLAPEGTGLTRADVLGPDPQERAKVLCSLYLDDLAAAIRDEIDPDFGFSRYAEHLGAAVPDFGVLLRRLRRRSPVDRILEAHVARALRETKPTMVGVTCPFPGTLLGAFRIARIVRHLAPDARLVLGGGYVNTELRALNDPRVGRFFDTVMYDEGYGPWCDLLGRKADVPPFVRPSYRGIDLAQYIDLAETANPMHRLWSDGRWIKLQLARGCYWHKCAFCDVSLDYIKCFQMPSAATIADAMEALAAETGERGFHFTDEAIPPKLARELSRELIRRKFTCRWWGNVRFDASYTPALARLMARAGCIAVTGGLECATDRLLKLMNKGITLGRAAVRARPLPRGRGAVRVLPPLRAHGPFADRPRAGTVRHHDTARRESARTRLRAERDSLRGAECARLGPPRPRTQARALQLHARPWTRPARPRLVHLIQRRRNVDVGTVASPP